MSRPIFSLVIPCHNPDKTIVRLFDSLTRQGIKKSDLEIIVVDDASESLDYQNIIRCYDFNIKYVNTNVEIHCPSNTRKEGLKHVTGAFVCFCDQDDLFEDNAFKQVKDFILKNAYRPIYVVSTIMFGCKDDENKTMHSVFKHAQAWLHGKWYSMDNLIIPYKVDFKENLKTHEDIYFNSLALSYLFRIDRDWDYLDIVTYKWIDNPESLTRKPTNDRGYLFENFNDYLVAAGEPFWEGAKDENNIVFRNQVLMTLLHAYFYYESVSYFCGANDYADTANFISDYIHRLIDEVGMSAEYIIDFIYEDPYKYYNVLDDCQKYCGKFIPKTSLRDFVFKLANK